jgi:hypothetical protein
VDRFDDIEDIDEDLFDSLNEDREFEEVPKGWTLIKIAVPRDFLGIYEETLNAYKKLRESDKDFPAFEAMVIEAKNSLEAF